MAETPHVVVPVDRTIIEDKLLMALEDDDKVAAVLTEADLDALIHVIESQPVRPLPDRHRSLLAGFRKLKQSAFGI